MQLRRRQLQQQQGDYNILQTQPFLWVWRLEMISPQENDRQPTRSEYDGVAEATVQWLDDTFSTMLLEEDSFNTPDATTTSATSLLLLEDVTATIRNVSTSWDPQRTFGPHTVALDCSVTLGLVQQQQAAITDTVRSLLSDISSKDMKRFVSNYIRSIGPASSVFRFTKQSATFVSQITDSSNVVDEDDDNEMMHYHREDEDPIQFLNLEGETIPPNTTTGNSSAAPSLLPTIVETTTMAPSISPAAAVKEDRKSSPDLYA